MSIFNQLKETEAQQHEQTIADYWTFLVGLDTAHPSASDTKTVQKYAKALDKTVAQIEADHKQVIEARGYLATLAETDGANDRAVAAEVEHMNACRKRQDGWKELNQSVHDAYMKQESAFEEQRRQAEAKRNLSELKGSNPYLAAAIEKTP